MTPSSQQSPGPVFQGHASSGEPAKTAEPTGVPPGPEPSGGPLRHAAQDHNMPTPKYEVPQEDLPAQADDVTTSAESANLGDRYTPGSANGSPAPLQTNFTPAHGK